MTTWSQSLLMQGRQQGIQEGIQTGEAATLLRLLTRRFGPLGVPMTQRVQQASSAQLKQWLDNILDARSLDEVFGGG